jgi:cell division protein ZapA (FtsZ GTPase activity inhibitor)
MTENKTIAVDGKDYSVMLQESDSDAIEIARDIARQMFGTDQLLLLTTGNLFPSKKI